MAEPLYDGGDGGYGAGLILAAAYTAEGRLQRAFRVYHSLLNGRPGDRAVQSRIDELDIKGIIARAEDLVAAKNYERAVALLRLYYDPSKPRYDVGMALAKAYLRSGKPEKAAEVYAELARAYPGDHEFDSLRIRALLAARRYRPAVHIYRSLPPAARAAMRGSLGTEARKLYLYSISVGGQLVKDTNGYPDEHVYGVRLKAVTGVGTVLGQYRRENRFGLGADDYRVDYYYSLSRGWYGYLSYAHSPQHTFLPVNSYAAAIDKALGAVTLMASYRHLAFEQTSADVYFGGIGIYPVPRLFLRTGVYYVPQTGGYSVMLAPIWYLRDGVLYGYLTAGQLAEQLNVSGALFKTPSYGVRLGRRYFITPRLGFSMEGFYEHRSGLYDRTGLKLYVTWRW